MNMFLNQNDIKGQKMQLFCNNLMQDRQCIECEYGLSERIPILVLLSHSTV